MQLQGDTSGLKVSPVPELRGWGGVGLGWTYENLKTNEITQSASRGEPTKDRNN